MGHKLAVLVSDLNNQFILRISQNIFRGGTITYAYGIRYTSYFDKQAGRLYLFSGCSPLL